MIKTKFKYKRILSLKVKVTKKCFYFFKSLNKNNFENILLKRKTFLFNKSMFESSMISNLINFDLLIELKIVMQ